MRGPALPWPATATGEPQRGTALVVVLLFASFLAGLMAVALQGVSSGARSAAVFLNEMRADEMGRGAADAVASYIQTGAPVLRRGGAFTFHVDKADVDVEYRSESARVDVNKAPIELVAAVLAAAGANADVVAEVKARIAEQRGVEAPAAVIPTLSLASTSSPVPARGGTPFAKPAAPLAVLLEQPVEALDRWHVPRDIALRALPVFTVANGTATVDPVLADRLVLSALLDDEARVDDFIERRTQGFSDAGSALALLPVDRRPFVSFADVSAVRALVQVTVAHRFKRRYEIILDPPAFAGQAPSILSWRPLY